MLLGRALSTAVARAGACGAKGGAYAAKAGPIRRAVREAPAAAHPNRLYALCTAESYDFSRLKPFLEQRHAVSALACDDVLHCRLALEAAEPAEVFVFENGSFVYWSGAAGAGEAVLRRVRSMLEPFEVGSAQAAECEELQFRHDSTQPARLEGEAIVVPGGASTEAIMAKLAFSNGLADSVKLATLEHYLQEHIAKVKHIPAMLQSGGRIGLTRRQVLQLIGELLHFRAVLNLQSELLDTPDLYWSEPQLEGLYLRVSRLLETRTRIHVLNKKLDYANEMAHVLRSHLSEQHGLKLEWGIIALIAVEVAFEVLHYI